MKYTSLKQKSTLLKHIDAPSKGINMSSDSCDISEDSLSYAKNVIYKDGYIKTRKGFFTEVDSLLDTSMCDGAQNYDYRLTDSTVNIDADILKIATANVKYDDSSYFVFVFGIDKNKCAKSLGYMHFGRLDTENFYCPENIVFYSGKPQGGGGIFALISLENIADISKKYYAIYEVDNDFGKWNAVNSFYIPTVYINGRGNAYESLEWSFNSNPLKLESRNLLNGSFYAYYSSDGYSSNFRLPFTDIDNSSVICRIYYSNTQYTEWLIAADETSAKQSFYGADVIANIDREKGIIYFTTANGEYAIPISSNYSENNIRIMAKKAIKGGFDAVVSSQYVAVCGKKYLFSGGNEKNRLYYAEYETPLYFPQVFDNEIGTTDEIVTSISVLNDKLLAFKSSKVYEITVKNSGYFNTTSLLADNGSFFKKTDTFSVKQLSGSIGGRQGTVAECGSRTVWLGTDGNIYLLDSGGGSIRKLQSKVGTVFERLISEERVSSVGVGENYVLSSDAEIIIINSDNEWYHWKLPQDITVEGMTVIDNSLSILYRYKNSDCCYIAGYEGEKDVLIYGKGSNQNIEKMSIESEITLKSFDFNSMASNKCIKNVDLRLGLDGKCRVSIGDDEIYSIFSLDKPKTNDLKTVRLITDLAGVKYIKISVSSNNGISFGGADIYYTV